MFWHEKTVFPSEFSFFFLREIRVRKYSILFTSFSKFPVRKIFAGLTKFQPQMVSKLPNGSALCTLCGSVYSSAFTARTHIIRKHIIPQRFQCRICQAIIEHRLDFSNHIIRKHQVKGCKDILKNYAIPLPYY